MKLVLEDEEVDQYFAIRDEHSQLLAKVNELVYKISTLDAEVRALRQTDEEYTQEEDHY